MSEHQRDRVLALNEDSHRKVNEAIDRGRWPGEGERSSYRCECARRGCTALLELTHATYERMRSDARRFVVLAGHEDPRVEDVVERGEGYLLVRKRGEAGKMARATDPRR